MGVTILGCRPHRVVMRLRAGKDCAELSALLHPEGENHADRNMTLSPQESCELGAALTLSRG